MIELWELQQLVAFKDEGTLSKASENLYVSQPTITRTMQHLEEEFGVTLFDRGKNKVTFNAVGDKAVEEARLVLHARDRMVEEVKECDRKQRTITVASCAPAPLWSLVPSLSHLFPGLSIASRLVQTECINEEVAQGLTDIGIIEKPETLTGILCIPFIKEQLYVCLPKDHPLAKKQTLSFDEINGYNFLLRSEIGFWDSLCRKRMPSSKFLVQTDTFALHELIKTSSLGCFTTNLVKDEERSVLSERVCIPMSDEDAAYTYQIIVKESKRELIASFI